MVIDGRIEGASVFLDLNGNLVRDDGEPISLPTDATGSFTLSAIGLSEAQLRAAKLVTHVPGTAKDEDDGGQTLLDAGRSGFTFMAPVSAVAGPGNSIEAVVSPLSTQVAQEILASGVGLERAVQVVQERLALPAGVNPLADYVAADNALLRTKARILTVAMGEANRLMTQSGAELEPEERIAAAVSLASAIIEERKDAIVAAAQTAAVPTAPPSAPGPNSAPTPAPLPVSDIIHLIQTRVAEAPNDNNSEPVAPSAPPPQAVQNAIAQATAQAQASANSSNRPVFTDYVVFFKPQPGNRPTAQSLVPRGGTVKFEYRHIAQGFAVSLPATVADAFLEAMNNNPNVDRVEVDRPISLSQITQSSATWGLDRVDQRALPLSRSYTYVQTGAGVRAYVIDTGIRASHAEFSGRLAAGFSAISDGLGTDDCNGHGTHVAGTIGGTTFGVAKQVTLVPVRVLDCNGSGTLSGVIAGVDWVAGQTHRPAVANMSLGAGASSTLDTVVAGLINQGVTTVVAAGNSNDDACKYSPAREPLVITVAATGSNDARASFSNFGSCVDVFAPGASITSAWITSNTASNTISGTSMAAPHVAGHVVQILQANTGFTPDQIESLLLSNSTPNVVTSASGSPNRLLYTLLPTVSEPVSPPPVVEPEPTPEPTPATSAVALSASTTKVKSSWTAVVTLTATNGTQVVPGVVMTGSFSAGGSSLTCITGTTGQCAIRSGLLGNRTVFTTFTLLSATGANFSYTVQSTDRLPINKP